MSGTDTPDAWEVLCALNSNRTEASSLIFWYQFWWS